MSPPVMSLLMPLSRKRPSPLMKELLCECFTDRLNICSHTTHNTLTLCAVKKTRQCSGLNACRPLISCLHPTTCIP